MTTQPGEGFIPRNLPSTVISPEGGIDYSAETDDAFLLKRGRGRDGNGTGSLGAAALLRRAGLQWRHNQASDPRQLEEASDV
jgi:hypothetical protein